jgi:hypothetical protein
VAAACAQAEATSSPNFYYAPCQDSLNVDNYLQYAESTAVNYKVRVRNTGNLALTGITYSWAENDAGIGAPGDCGALPSTIGQGAAPAFCTFSRAVLASNPVDGVADYTISAVAEGNAGTLPTGQTNGAAIVKVVPVPKLAVNLRAAPYRLGGSGNGVLGNPQFTNGPLTLDHDPTSALPEIQNPTGWFSLTVVNQGGPAENFTVSVSEQGSAVTLPCTIPSTLAESGQSGSSFTCLFPRTFDATQAYAFVATANATNAVILGGTQPAVTVTTAICSGAGPVIPNLVNTLAPTPDGSSKTVGEAKTLWLAAGFTNPASTSPSGASNSLQAITQSEIAYTCANNANETVTVGAQ